MDAVIRIAAVSTLLLSSLLLMKASRNWRWTLCLGLLVISVSAFVMDNGVTDILRPTGIVEDLSRILTKFTIGFLWLFLLATFEEGFRFRPAYLAATLLWCIVGLMGLPYWSLGTFAGLLNFVTIVMGLGLIAHALWRMKSGFSGDLRTTRREARFWVGIILSGTILVDIFVDLALGYSWRAPTYAIGQNLIAGLTASALILYLWQADLSDLMASDEPGEFDTLQQSPASNPIVAIMRSQQLYLRPNLKFGDFAQMIDLSQSDLRYAINHKLGFGHFTSFVNHFRIEHAKSLLEDPSHENDKIIAIAFDSGFASLQSFQRVFKTMVGKTPTQWRRDNAGQNEKTS